MPHALIKTACICSIRPPAVDAGAYVLKRTENFPQIDHSQAMQANYVNSFCALEGPYGRIEVLAYSHNLVTHAHSQAQLAFWMGGGSAHAHVAGQRIAFAPDRALAVNRLGSHDLCLDHADAPAVFLVLYIDDAFLRDCNRACDSFVFASASIHLDALAQSSAVQVMQKVLLPQTSADLPMEVDLRSLLAHIVDQAAPPKPAREVPRLRHLVDYRLRVAMAHMRANVGSPTPTEELAEVVGLSRSRLCALFLDELGTSPHVFWNTVRLEAATQRLNADHANLTELALDLGFSTSGNFSRFFREHTGVTPSAYRRYRHAA